MSSEITKQVGGDHYQTPTNYQHWDWVSDLGLGYLGATATKYICRHKRKNGRVDVEKAMSYLDKMDEVGCERWGSIPAMEHSSSEIQEKTAHLCYSLGIEAESPEGWVLFSVACAENHEDLREVRAIVDHMLANYPEQIVQDTETEAMRKFNNHPSPFGSEGE